MRPFLSTTHPPLATALALTALPVQTQTPPTTRVQTQIQSHPGIQAQIPAQMPAQTTAPHASADIMCKPVAERAATADLGCWILSDQPVDPLTPAQAFWHLDTFPTLAAATAAKGPSGTVQTALGKVWLLTLAERSWQPPAGASHVSTVGPLPLDPAKHYAAQYMEATFSPGMRSVAHTHPGTEAFYTTTGAVCLETPAGASFGRAGEPPIIIGEGIPMQLTAVGTGIRRSLVLILHDATRPASHPAHDWTPKNLCNL